ncbi:hypothetical protein [Microcoleus sp. B4-C1]|uniref:hypothetical protein n=1 Tax=Microcoleus sp. B4-C1 TaxID=2818660 RepID=UPI002FD1DAC0
MLLRYAKLAGGLRLLIATAAPLAVSTVSVISVRSAAYLIGFGLSSILSIWLPVVLSLVTLTGAFGGSTDTTICDAYRAQIPVSTDSFEYFDPDSGCGSVYPPCPPGKKVWLQVLWASPRGNASDAKGCFIVAYSQDSNILPPVIEYNPYLPVAFVTNQALPYAEIKGNRLAGANTEIWKDLDSVNGWDKGYWQAEFVHPECRGWRPGWSFKVK